MKSHLQSYPCPLQINSFWNLGFLLGITIILAVGNKILSDTRFYDPWVYQTGHSSPNLLSKGKRLLSVMKFLKPQ